MTYIQGFVLAVPAANKQKFIDHAALADPAFLEHGATRILECWQDNVEKGHTTDFFGAVDCKSDEAVVFSWLEWPSKSVKDAMEAKMADLMKSDPRFDPEKNPMPFDGKRMIYGDFTPIVDEGQITRAPYVQGFLVPVPSGNQEAYRKAALAMWEIMKDYGATRVIEAWQDNVPKGEQTDFFRAVKAKDGESVVFSFVEWDSKESADSSHGAMMEDERMKQFEGQEANMPFDGKRMIYGGFVPVVELSQELAGA